MSFPLYHDDNFGAWDNMDDPDMVDFYFHVQRESIEKKCAGCGRIVKLRKDYDICNTCADKREQGWDI